MELSLFLYTELNICIECYLSPFGCKIKTPQSKWLKNNTNFLTVLEARGMILGCQHGWVLGTPISWVAGFSYPQVEEGVREFYGVSFTRQVTVFMRIPLLWTNHPLTPSRWTLGFQHVNFGETQTFRP